MPTVTSMLRLLQGALALLPSLEKFGPSLRGLQSDGKINVGKQLHWTANNKELRVNGKPFHLKGLSWFGIETDKGFLLGLEQRPLDSILQFLVDNKFNAIRIPFSTKWALDYDRQIWGNFKDGDINGMTRRQFLNHIVEKMGQYKIQVMVDFHRLDDQQIPELWYSNEFPYDAMMQGWNNILGDLKKHWNLFAIDLKNEPHGAATWGSGNPATDWDKAASQIGKALLDNHPDFTGLVFVEGIVYSIIFSGVKDHPIDLGSPERNKRIVWTPHQYGPSVVGDGHYNGFFGFPDDQVEGWEGNFGFLEDFTGQATVMGEWGGKYLAYQNDKDKIWQDRFAKYLVDRCMSDNFVWDLNPESGDTGGVLRSDWWNPENEKLALYATVQPDPSWLAQEEDGSFSLVPGSYANPACKP